MASITKTDNGNKRLKFAYTVKEDYPKGKR